jgi:hypothetical protein
MNSEMYPEVSLRNSESVNESVEAVNDSVVDFKDKDSENEIITGTRYISDGDGEEKNGKRDLKVLANRLERRKNDIHMLKGQNDLLERELACLGAKVDAIFTLFSNIIVMNKPIQDIVNVLSNEKSGVVEEYKNVDESDDIQKDNELVLSASFSINDDDGDDDDGDDDDLNVSAEPPELSVVDTIENGDGIDDTTGKKVYAKYGFAPILSEKSLFEELGE